MSTKLKPFYLMEDKQNKLNNLAYKSYHKKLPENLNDDIKFINDTYYDIKRN